MSFIQTKKMTYIHTGISKNGQGFILYVLRVSSPLFIYNIFILFFYTIFHQVINDERGPNNIFN